MRCILLTLVALFLPMSAATAKHEQPFVPVFEENFPDPFILFFKGEFLAYATNPEGAEVNVQMARSPDLVEWELVRDENGLHDPIPDLPPWAREGWTWAPEIVRHNERYLIYFTAKERSSGLQCVGVAQSADPLGPFVSEATEPLICQREIGGTIDPSVFTDVDGTSYLYYKNDGNHPDFARETEIFGQPLAADGLSLVGKPVALLTNDQPWEEHVIESPTLVRNGDNYVMLFSANHFGWETHQRLSPYAMGYARCEGPLGPCIDAPENPILYSYNDRRAGCLSGPGHQAVFDVGERQFIVFHAHIATSGCRRTTRGRQMYVAPLLWQDGTPQVGVSLRADDAQRGKN